MAEDVSLYLDNIFDEKAPASPNRVTLKFWNYEAEISKMIPVTLCGLLSTEPSISSQNKWGPVFGEIASLTGDLTAFTNLIGSKSIFTWVGAAAQAWKGTNPISLIVDFYLINYRPGLKLEEKLKSLTKLTAISTAAGNKIAEHLGIAVHGGYNLNVIGTNKNISMFDNGNWGKFEGGANIQTFGEQLLNQRDMPQGVLTAQIGTKATIDNLLLTRLDVTPSLPEVEEGKALFYKVNASFVGSRPLMTTDVDNMY